MSDSVTMTRAEYEALLDRIEDAEARAVLASLERESPTPAADYLPAERAKRIIAGASPVRVWREHRGLTLRQLAEASGLGLSYISEIERGAKSGSIDAISRLARALGLSLDDLVLDRRG